MKNINLAISPKEKFAIVGKSGCGKSTLIQALFRMMEIEEESNILIDKNNIKDISISDLRNFLSIIPQSPFLFTDTIRNNIDPF